ncbi:MAG: T9SS type A sorting domain-containing protein [Chitinophagales bacterium]|nr:T9SS type A sorting domain-containing protein [Chitinophagales bacterium]
MSLKSTLIVFSILIMHQFIFAFDDMHKVCGQEQFVEAMRHINPNYNNNVNEDFNSFYDIIDRQNSRLATDDTIYTIQVVVHIVHIEDNNQQNIPDDIVFSQINQLNKDFSATNEDGSNLRPIFTSIKGNPKLQFQLATLDPDGNPTNGITRTFAKPPSQVSNDPLEQLLSTISDWFKKDTVVKTVNGVQDTTIGKSPWDTKRYLNIWVTNLNYNRDLSEGVLGGFAFAPPGLRNWPFGVGYPAEDVDGVSIDYRFFGVNNYYAQTRPPYVQESIGKGRTTVHEVGHYLGLRHIWGDYGNLFGVDCNIFTADLLFTDGIKDTPPQKAPASSTLGEYRCDTTINTCDAPIIANNRIVDYPDLFENYMDYSGDNCYNMFTKQQADFMRNVLKGKRQGIIIDKTVEQVPTAIKNNKNDAYLVDVYPNPTSNTLQIKHQFVNSNINVNIIDMTGRLVYQNQYNANNNNFSIDVSSLDNAMYLIQLSTEKHNATISFIKN